MPWISAASPTISSTRRRGFRLGYGFGKIICTLRRAACTCPALSVLRSMPSSKTCPEDGASKPLTIRPKGDLPQPDSPTNPITSPGMTCKSTASSACVTAAGRIQPRAISCRSSGRGLRSPNRLPTLRTSTRGITLSLSMASSTMMQLHGMGCGGRGCRMETAHEMRVQRLCGLRARQALFADALAARSKCAGWRQMQQIRCQTGNLAQALTTAVIARQAADQALRVVIQRLLYHLRYCALFDDTAAIHHGDVIGQARHHRQIVRNPDQRGAVLARQLLHL